MRAAVPQSTAVYNHFSPDKVKITDVQANKISLLVKEKVKYLLSLKIISLHNKPQLTTTTENTLVSVCMCDELNNPTLCDSTAVTPGQR